MLRSTVRSIAVLVAGLFVAMALPVQAGAGATLVVVPARETIINLIFDVAKYHKLERVSCSTDAKGNFALYRWDVVRGDWAKMTVGDLGSAQGFQARPEQVIVIGGDRDIPREVLSALSWPKDVARITALDLVTVVNGLNEKLNFPASEWRYLARKYNLGIKDMNEDRRRYGRWGRSDARATTPPPPESEKIESEPVLPPPVATPAPEKGVPEPMPEKGVPVTPAPEVTAPAVEAAPAAIPEPEATPILAAPAPAADAAAQAPEDK